MLEGLTGLRRPRCVLVYALAPDGMAAADANRAFNEFIADTSLPTVIFHDHFIGQPGGLAICFVETPEERRALAGATHLRGWRVELRPLVFSRSPAAFDEQIAFTLRAYRSLDWETLQQVHRPRYGGASCEAESGEEDPGEDK